VAVSSGQRQRGTDCPSAARRRYVRLKGVRLAAVTETETVQSIVDAAEAKQGHWTITANVDHLRRYREEPMARRLINNADLVVADGMPLVWASWLVGAPLPERVAGSNMVWSICEAASKRQQSIFLLGGDPGVAARAAEVLQRRYSGLRIAGTMCPPIGFERSSNEVKRIQETLHAAMPDIVFVALGFPKQDLLIRRLKRACPWASFVGVGISLSFVSGDVTRAPGWAGHLGLEWAYRLLQEPGRLARRYLLHGVPFAFRLLLSAARNRRQAGAYWGWEPDDLASLR